ncbi:MAG: lysylphosphatidylglycerol synthase domain-containing protein [Candidatus Omnitrophota bacterium]
MKLNYPSLGKWAIAIVFLVLVFLFFFLYQEKDTLLSFPWRFNWGYILLSSFFHSMGLGTTYLIWSKILYRISGFKNYSLNFKIYYLSSLAKRIPTSLPYIGTRLSMYSALGLSSPLVINCILLENLLITISGVAFFFMLLPFYSFSNSLYTMSLFTLLLVLCVLVFFRPTLLIQFTNLVLRKFKKNTIDVDLSRIDLMTWILFYTIPWIFAGLSLHFLILSLGITNRPGLIDTIGISTITSLVSLVSMILPGGFGLKELAGSTLLSIWVPFSVGLVITIIYRILQIIDEILWSIIALIPFVKSKS